MVSDNMSHARAPDTSDRVSPASPKLTKQTKVHRYILNDNSTRPLVFTSKE